MSGGDVTLTAPQLELLQAIRSGVEVAGYAGGRYWRWDTGNWCTRPAKALLDKLLVEQTDHEERPRKHRLIAVPTP